MTFPHFVTLLENRAGVVALQQVAACLSARTAKRAINPVFLHGTSGVGKSYLVNAFIKEVTRQNPQWTVRVLPAADLQTALRDEEPAPHAESWTMRDIRNVDLLVVEDLQYLPPRWVAPLVQLFDARQARQAQMVFTASLGPRQLALPARLTSRLACGLVVAMGSWQPASRLALLQDKAERRQIAVSQEVLTWLAEHLTGGGRQLDGAIAKLEALARVHGQALDVASVAQHFLEQSEASRPTVEKIAETVGDYFRVAPKQLQSSRRSRSVVVPRQVGMYLARKLTALTLDQIGSYFGGRDHSTVLYACRKVEKSLAREGILSGTIRQLQSSFT